MRRIRREERRSTTHVTISSMNGMFPLLTHVSYDATVLYYNYQLDRSDGMDGMGWLVAPTRLAQRMNLQIIGRYTSVNLLLLFNRHHQSRMNLTPNTMTRPLEPDEQNRLFATVPEFVYTLHAQMPVWTMHYPCL